MEKHQQQQIDQNLINDNDKDKDNEKLHVEEINQRKLIFVLTHAPLEVAKMKDKKVLLSSEENKNYIQKKLGKDHTFYRPDITHQSLLAILDSPLNKAGCLDIYIETHKNILIHINPLTKIPRTYGRFARLIAQLLVKSKIKREESDDPLMKVLKNGIKNHIPSDAIVIGTSTKARLVKLKEYIPKLPKTKPLVFVVGNVAKGNPCLECDYLDDCVSISRYPLSTACCLSKIIHVFEETLDLF